MRPKSHTHRSALLFLDSRIVFAIKHGQGRAIAVVESPSLVHSHYAYMEGLYRVPAVPVHTGLTLRLRHAHRRYDELV